MAAPTAFTTPLAIGSSSSLLPPPAPPCSPAAVASRKPAPALAPATAAPTMVVNRVADKFMNISQTREAKQAATPFGVYTVQCTEATAGANTAEATRLAALAANMRLRQSSAAARAADLFATRRAAIVNARGSHAAEAYAVRFPARAAASVRGRAEALRACARYFPAPLADAAGTGDAAAPAKDAAEYMFECVDRQYKAAKVPGGVYTTACADGRVAGDADTARVAALAAQFRAGLLPPATRAQMRYDAVAEATALARGCAYEEAYFQAFPKAAAAMRYSTGAYATAAVMETTLLTGIKGLDIAQLVKSDNVEAVWPGFKIRPATTPEQRSPWWKPSPLKDYSPMSPAAVEYGLKFNEKPFVPSKYNGWTPGWQPSSSLMASSSE